MRVGDSVRPLLIATLLMISVFAIGVVGYTIIHPAHSVFSAVYMTVITLTTVGYEEHISLKGNTGGEIFTVILLFLGVGTFVYFFSSVTEFVVAGHLERLMWRRKMQKAIGKLENHYIVCGGGDTGRHIVKELIATERPFVLIEMSHEILDSLHAAFGDGFPVVIGDATEDEHLIEAGIERAAGLFSSIGNDKENLIVTVSARLLNPDLRIVCKCVESMTETKIRKAGANIVISPNRIGGLRMISEMVRPAVVSFLDVMLRDEDRRLRVEESKIGVGSKLEGRTVAELRKLHVGDVLLVALRLPDGEWIYNPDDEVTLTAGMTLIFMGSPSAREEMERVVEGG